MGISPLSDPRSGPFTPPRKTCSQSLIAPTATRTPSCEEPRSHPEVASRVTARSCRRPMRRKTGVWRVGIGRYNCTRFKGKPRFYRDFCLYWALQSCIPGYQVLREKQVCKVPPPQYRPVSPTASTTAVTRRSTSEGRMVYAYAQSEFLLRYSVGQMLRLHLNSQSLSQHKPSLPLPAFLPFRSSIPFLTPPPHHLKLPITTFKLLSVPP